jgi:hypothetical protein
MEGKETTEVLHPMQESFNVWITGAVLPLLVGQYSHQILLRPRTDFRKSAMLAAVLWQNGFQRGSPSLKLPNSGTDRCVGQFIWFAGVFMAGSLPKPVLAFDRAYEIDEKIDWHAVEMINAEYALK